MKRFRAPIVNDPTLQSVVNSIQEAAFRAEPYVELESFKGNDERVREGMIAYADGTNWDPGSGQGVYAYYAGAWHKLG